MSTQLTLAFHDAQKPGMTAGDHTVTVTQKVTSQQNGELGKDYFQPYTQPVHVSAPRFALDPAAVHAVNPASGAASNFDQTLAHCTLRQPSLPWQRLISSDSKHKDLPWLALLILGPGEIHEDPAAQGVTTPRTGADVVKAENNVAVPVLTPTAAEAVQPCRTIDVPAEPFRQLCPRETDGELAHLAHVRKAKKASGLRGEKLVAGEFAVVLANRLPKKTGPYVAHLVSLEGHGARLSGTLPKETLRVRLVSLWSWTFTCDTGARHFPAVVTKLAQGDLLLRRPPCGKAGSAAAEKETWRRLERGYVPLPERLSSGEETLAWYRGPLTPVVPPELPGAPEAAASGDHAAIYVPDHGVFDISYASAWSLGRALALADADYVSSLTNWRGTTRRLVTRMLAAGPPGTGRWTPPATPAEALAAGCHGGVVPAVEAALHATPPVAGPAPAASWDATGHLTDLLGDHAGDVLHALADAGGTSDGVRGVRSWLERLDLLEQVPFCYLVPDTGMLPPESLRFFHVDPDWLTHLAAGARSLGRFGLVELLAERTVSAELPPPRPTAGLLLRSELVSACPGLVIEAFTSGTELPVMRRDVLSPDVLLCLLPDVPDKVVLRESAQGLHFGIDGPDSINLRVPGGKDCGKEMPGRKLTGLASFQRDTTRGVFTLGTKDSSLAGGLAKQHSIAVTSFKSSDLAVQLLNSPYQITFPSA